MELTADPGKEPVVNAAVRGSFRKRTRSGAG